MSQVEKEAGFFTPGQEPKISPPPVFDFHAAEKARNSVGSQFKEAQHMSPAFGHAAILSVYNSEVSQRREGKTLGSDPKRKSVLFWKLDSLERKEAQASDPANPLPTIGWEVEVSQQAFNKVNEN